MMRLNHYSCMYGVGVRTIHMKSKKAEALFMILLFLTNQTRISRCVAASACDLNPWQIELFQKNQELVLGNAFFNDF